MPESVFIAGDWGSTNLRLYLFRSRDVQPPELLASLSGPGCRQVDNNFEQVFFDLVADWIQHYGPVPVILSGAVGSNIGWHTVPYLDCPASPEQIARGTTKLTVRDLDIWFLSGLKTQTALGAPDVMRGEELQLLGWMLSDPSHQQVTEQLLVLPGTHNKWALVKDGRVQQFITAFTGELYELLENHSVLMTQPMTNHFSAEAYMQGVELAKTLETGQLLNALFTVRSRQIEGDLTAEDAASYLSGLLVGSDIMGSIKLLTQAHHLQSEVVIIGNQMLSKAYQLALNSLGVESGILDPTQIAAVGYQAVYQALNRDRDQ